MRRPHRWWLPLVILVCALGGCAAPAPTPNPGDPVTNAPTEEPRVAPALRVTVPCGDLANTSVLAEWFEISQTEDESTPVDTLDRAAVRTAGTLHCRWGDDSESEYGYQVSHLDLLVRAPSPISSYEDAVAGRVDDNYTEFDTAGDDSVLWCSTYGDIWSCGAEMKVGDLWVTAELQASQPSPRVSESMAKQNMRNSLQRAAAALRGASVGDAWVLPAGVVQGAPMCDGDRTQTEAILKEAFGLSDLDSYGGDVVYTDWVVFQQTESRECAFGAETHSLYLAVLPGGAWWGDTWASLTPSPYLGATLEPTDVVGADRALVGCSAKYCVAYAVVGGSIISLSGGGFSRESFTAGLDALHELAALSS